jgi:uncharacterized membrane protein YhaH (DUF805 family)
MENNDNLSIFGYHVKCLKNYVNFKGRARRKEYWGGMALVTFVVAFVLSFLGALIFGEEFGGILANLYSLAVLLPSIAAGIRRMHDTGRSGWFLLVPIANIVWACQDSEAGENKYGPNPKGHT